MRSVSRQPLTVIVTLAVKFRINWVVVCSSVVWTVGQFRESHKPPGSLIVRSVLLHVTYNKVQDDSNQSYPLTASCLEMSQSEDGARHSLAETQRVSRPASGNISGPAGVGSLAVLDSRSRLPVELQQIVSSWSDVWQKIFEELKSEKVFIII